MSPVVRCCDIVGLTALGWCRSMLDVASLMVQAVVVLIRPGALPSVAWTVLRRQILFTGVEAMPFAALLALLTAMMVVVQFQVSLTGIGQSNVFSQLLVAVLVRELGPLLVALLIIGRSGTAMATELANMQVRGEVAALERQGIDPLAYLVVPRLGGAVVAVTGLTLQYIAVSLVAGFLLPHLLLVSGAPDLETFVGGLARHLTLVDLVSLLAKTLVPGALIALISCREGLLCPVTVTAVPQAATRAVVRSITAVFVWDALVSAISYAA